MRNSWISWQIILVSVNYRNFEVKKIFIFVNLLKQMKSEKRLQRKRILFWKLKKKKIYINRIQKSIFIVYLLHSLFRFVPLDSVLTLCSVPVKAVLFRLASKRLKICKLHFLNIPYLLLIFLFLGCAQVFVEKHWKLFSLVVYSVFGY